MSAPIYFVMEFHGAGDPFFGGSAADWSLYRTEDGGHAFMSAAEAQRRKLVKAYFPAKDEAERAGRAASKRHGRLSALDVQPRPEFPIGQLRWIVGRIHVGTPDADVCAEIEGRAVRAGITDPDLIAQLCAHALIAHRANQALVAQFRL